MKRYIVLYRDLIRVHLRNVFAYRVILALWAIAGVVQTYVAIAIWRAVESAGNAPAGFTGDEIVGYFLMVMLVDEFTHSWTYWIWEWYVRTGRFAGKLAMPIHPLHDAVADNLAVKVASMSIKIPIALTSFWMLGVSVPSPDGALNIVGAVAAVIGAYSLRTVIEASIACLAFEITRMSAIATPWILAWMFLAGAFAPTELLPGVVADIAYVLPFRWALEFPVRCLTGDIYGAEMAMGLGIQTLWLGASLLVFKALWSRGLRRFAAVGG
jgi:ABC-2 type transport system permease protein